MTRQKKKARSIKSQSFHKKKSDSGVPYIDPDMMHHYYSDTKYITVPKSKLRSYFWTVQFYWVLGKKEKKKNQHIQNPVLNADIFVKAIPSFH